ncbi:hypothetical protein GPECTOR_57g520 [Gonium pectorale]|uniref:Uncharacterized protein n=1 Tax=Gonium pectorale TaxID=33097 RepID=A0A150G7B3_GONPE|nr:hypothetical protein GPECTOR_57g520 [Gonium pectorale]|eukprot:KXZ45230.1 hypothetical protein GPECTOR_57g520 [Gonium pectorale]
MGRSASVSRGATPPEAVGEPRCSYASIPSGPGGSAEERERDEEGNQRARCADEGASGDSGGGTSVPMGGPEGLRLPRPELGLECPTDKTAGAAMIAALPPATAYGSRLARSVTGPGLTRRAEEPPAAEAVVASETAAAASMVTLPRPPAAAALRPRGRRRGTSLLRGRSSEDEESSRSVLDPDPDLLVDSKRARRAGKSPGDRLPLPAAPLQAATASTGCAA